MKFVAAAAVALRTLEGAPPEVGDRAPDFSLPALRGGTARLSEATAKGPVALVVLRGYPGYQCPFCSRQVQDFLKQAAEFARAGARVLFVYPGPGQALETRAAEFLSKIAAPLPEHFEFLLDPDYAFTNLYGLRWDAPRETAYPSTFLIDRTRAVFYKNVSTSHGGRTSAAEVLAAIRQAASR